MDILMIFLLCVLLLVFDYFPKRTRRSRRCNCCYLLLMFLSITLLLVYFLLPDAPKIVNIITALFPQR